MKFTAIACAAFFAACASAQAVRGPKGNCGFPNGPDCQSIGRGGANNLEQFIEPANSPGDNCCLFPLRCGNGDPVQLCEKVGGKAKGGKAKGKAKATN